MKKPLVGLFFAISIVTAALYFYNPEPQKKRKVVGIKEGSITEAQSRFAEGRLRYEFEMLKDPSTGKIPYGIFERELAIARMLPARGYDDIASSQSGSSGTSVLNNYLLAGPDNIGGRTRAVAFDKRYNGTSNRVIIGGSVSGGIMRSTDGGTTWTRVSPEGDIHNLTALAQDPTNLDTWYAGGGEAYGNSTSELGATYLGNGIWKSVDNGASWTRLPLNTIINLDGTGTLGAGTLEAFDHPFDYVHRIAVNPTNGDLYIAGHRRLVKSSNGGANFRVVFESAPSAFNTNGQMDITVSGAGRLLLAVNGGAAIEKRGVWVSASGDVNTWTRIAGGQTLGVDSVAGWRGGSYEVLQSGNPPLYQSKRIILTLAPSDNNIAYIFYENGLSNESPDLKPEADLFRLDISGNTYTWSNRSANMPDFQGGNLSGSDPLSVQNGYDMEVKVKPDNPNVVFIGGTNLYRSTDGFSSTANTAWINGYNTNFTYQQYPNGHADIHIMAFHPQNPNIAICGDDGGIRLSNDISAASVSWTPYPNYQTVQFYYVAIDPGEGRNNFAGGAQDNGTLLRDRTGSFGPIDSNTHRRIFSGDGTSVGLSRLDQSSQVQYLYGASQYGNILRLRMAVGNQAVSIRPPNLTTAFEGATNEYGEFITNFRLNPDNTEDLYYVNFNRLFRTTAASSVTAGWTELLGVGQAVNPSNPTGGRNIAIRGMAFSRGTYTTSHALYLGTTNGKIFRLDNPRNIDASTPPIDITPSGLTGNVQDIAVNPNNDDEIMAVVSNYNVVSIWWTNNAKSASPSWRTAEGNLAIPSIRSCAIITKRDASNNPVTEYYVGTSVGLYSTVNLSATLTANATPVWAREGGNLLNYAVVRSLAYRPGDNVLLLGTHGNGMYFTYLGTSNFTPNLNTGINPITNDRNFINSVYPTLTTSAVTYQVGNLFTIKRLHVQLIKLSGQVILKKETGYQNGTIDISALPKGNYILTITSNDLKYRHVQKIVKQ